MNDGVDVYSKIRCTNCPAENDSSIEEIAERAAEKAVEKLTSHLYQEVGRSILSKLFYIFGIFIIGAALWLRDKGYA
jgi:hypothetical protein